MQSGNEKFGCNTGIPVGMRNGSSIDANFGCSWKFRCKIGECTFQLLKFAHACKTGSPVCRAGIPA